MSKLILDTDPGIDDAICLLMALKSDVELLGVTINFGNSPSVDLLASNALNILHLAGKDGIPVFNGARSPLSGKFAGHTEAVGVHGSNALGGVELEQAPTKVSEISAAQFIVEQCKKFPGEVILCAVAPLTNVALALLMEPALPTLLKELVIMGGSLKEGGNVTPTAEANFFNDPVAARTVLHSGSNIVLVPLDITHQILVSRSEFERFKGTKYGDFVCAIGQACCDNLDTNAISMHDPAAMAYVLNPALFNPTRRVIMDVLVEGPARGTCLMDKRHLMLKEGSKFRLHGSEGWPTIDVLMDLGETGDKGVIEYVRSVISL